MKMSGHDSKYFFTIKKREIPELKNELNSQHKDKKKRYNEGNNCDDYLKRCFFTVHGCCELYENKQFGVE
jgi:hypothetical protein